VRDRPECDKEGAQSIVLCVDCHPEEGLILTSSKDLSVRVWRAATGRCLARAEGHVDAVGAVAVAPRGSAFCVSGSGDKCVISPPRCSAMAAPYPSEHSILSL
jgi:WD40 repeat protein